MSKKVSPLIDDKTIEFFETNFRTCNGGVTYVLEAFPGLYGKTMYDIKGVFTEGELKLILDVVNGLALTPQIAGKHLILDVGDGINIEELDKKWDVDGKELIKKINSLHYFTLACLEIWSRSFWEGKREGQEGYLKMDIEEYVKKLS